MVEENDTMLGKGERETSAEQSDSEFQDGSQDVEIAMSQPTSVL